MKHIVMTIKTGVGNARLLPCRQAASVTWFLRDITQIKRICTTKHRYYKQWHSQVTTDITANTVPEPGVGDLWEWDAYTKTLILKDGFSITGMANKLIYLPVGSTIIVEGLAEIFNYGAKSIDCEGSLVI